MGCHKKGLYENYANIQVEIFNILFNNLIYFFYFAKQWKSN